MTQNASHATPTEVLVSNMCHKLFYCTKMHVSSENNVHLSWLPSREEAIAELNRRFDLFITFRDLLDPDLVIRRVGELRRVRAEVLERLSVLRVEGEVVAHEEGAVGEGLVRDAPLFTQIDRVPAEERLIRMMSCQDEHCRAIGSKITANTSLRMRKDLFCAGQPPRRESAEECAVLLDRIIPWLRIIQQLHHY